MNSKIENNNKVIIWTLVLCLMVMMMVVIGGVTRLTGSGLSIVEWKPLMGAIPPLNMQDWMEVFSKYQASPQYKLVNNGMSLSEFQWIYFWEYFHRLIGRLLGLVFFIPWVLFIVKKHLDKMKAFKYLIGFLLGGLQGVMGWVMVASGLVEQPQVSHFRLAAHLILAFIILAYFWRLIWELNRENISYSMDSNEVENPKTFANLEECKVKTIKTFKHFFNLILIILILQIFYGAFVAGLRAGFISNTFPDMQGQFFPLGGLSMSPSWINFFENPLTVQWVHRILAWLLLLGVGGLYFNVRRNQFDESLQKKIFILLILIFIQFLLGITTLLFNVPLPLAVFHQIGAAIVMLNFLWVRWQFQSKYPKLSQ